MKVAIAFKYESGTFPAYVKAERHIKARKRSDGVMQLARVIPRLSCPAVDWERVSPISYGTHSVECKGDESFQTLVTMLQETQEGVTLRAISGFAIVDKIDVERMDKAYGLGQCGGGDSRGDAVDEFVVALHYVNAQRIVLQ